MLQEGGQALARYARKLREAQHLAREARQVGETYNREASQLRAEQQGAPPSDPATQARKDARAERAAASRNQAVQRGEQAHVIARVAAAQASGTFVAIAQGVVGLFVPGANLFLTSKGAADGVLGFRKQLYLSRELEDVNRLAGSTDEAVGRYFGRFVRIGSKLSRFAPALKFAGKLAPAAGGAFGLYQLVNPNSTTEQRVLGGLSAVGGGILTASAFGAFTVGAATLIPVAGAAILAGVGLYQLGKLTYEHWDDITWGVSKAAGAVGSGIAKTARWTGGKLSNVKDWTADRVSAAASAVGGGAERAGDAIGGAVHTVTKDLGAVAGAFGF